LRLGHNVLCSEVVHLPVMVCLYSGSNCATEVEGQ